MCAIKAADSPLTSVHLAAENTLRRIYKSFDKVDIFQK